MSLKTRLFRKKDDSTVSVQINNSIQSDNPSVKAIIELNQHISKLLSSDSYIAKSEYLKFIEARKDAVSYFKQLNIDNILKNFCSKNHMYSNWK